MLRALGDTICRVGVSLENYAYRLGTPKGLPAYAAFKPAIEDIHTEAQKYIYHKKMVEEDVSYVAVVPDKFVAPSAQLSSDAHLEKGCGIWYNCRIGANSSVGSRSTVMEGSSIEGDSNRPTVLGAGVLVFPQCKIGQGVRIHDGAVLKSGVTIQPGVTVAEGCVVGQGSVVEEGTKMEAREIWSGSPAQKVGQVDDETTSKYAEMVDDLVEKGIYHQAEHDKDIISLRMERQAHEDRALWAEDIMEDHINSDQGHLPLYLNLDVDPEQSPEKRGLLYDKGLDKGPEAQPDPVARHV